MNITEITSEKVERDTPLRLAAYCRVSSDSEDQLHSFATQIRYYKDYERKNPQYKLVDIYADEGLTGTCMKKRDELNRLIGDCKKGKIDRILVKSVSRFARNTQELLTVLRMLKELGVSVYFEEQGIDTDKINMEMIVTFPGMAAQQESITISENMRWSCQKRMESGEFNCSYPAYGFRKVNGNLEIDESEANVIRRIFNLYLQGMGTQRIANLLNEENVPRRPGQTKWHRSTIEYVLNNERYMGDALLQKKFTTETLPFRKKINRGEYPQYYVEGSNPAIISRDTYQAVQALKQERVTNGMQRRYYPLSKKLRCPECGQPFRRQVTEGVAYWLCVGRATGRTNCQNRRIREEAVYDAFVEMAWKFKDHQHWLLGALIHQLENLQSKGSPSQERLGQIDKSIADLAARNLIVTRLHNGGLLNAADYATQSAELNNQIHALRTERRKVLAEDENDEQLRTLRRLDRLLDEYEPRLIFDEALFDEMVESITVDSNAQLTFKLIGGLVLSEPIPEKRRCKSA